MAKGFLHLHVTVVLLFILLYTIKVYLLLANKPEALEKLRSKTKIADAVLGSLIIITGGYLTFIAPAIETYLIVKIVLVIASIPVGIIAMKKLNKPMAIAALLIYVYVFAVAKTKSLSLKKEAFVAPVSVVATDSLQTETSSIKEGEVIYTSLCVVCHGPDGKLMLNGAKDLSVSKLSDEEIITMVKNGKGLMTPFKDQLDEKQLQSVMLYVKSLRK
jgi:mono/diheme cytochrome c family protein